MSMYTKLNCETSRQNFITKIDKAIAKIEKNLSEMDFDNVQQRKEMDEIAGRMVTYCNTMKTKMEEYTFE